MGEALQIRGVVVAIDDDPSGTFHAELQLCYNGQARGE